MSRKDIFDEIEDQRKHQEQKWGNEADDTVNTPQSWTTYIAMYSSNWQRGDLPPLFKKEAVKAFRESMIKTATLAIAAIESLDRQCVKNGKAFYERDN